MVGSAEDLSPPQSPNPTFCARTVIWLHVQPRPVAVRLGRRLGPEPRRSWQPQPQTVVGMIRCLVAGEPVGFQNLFVGEREAGPYELIDRLGAAPEGSGRTNAWFEDASEDLSHVLFNEDAR